MRAKNENKTFTTGGCINYGRIVLKRCGLNKLNQTAELTTFIHYHREKVFLVLGVSLIIVACGGNKSGNDSAADSASSANKTAASTESNVDTAAGHNGTDKGGGTPSPRRAHN